MPSLDAEAAGWRGALVFIGDSAPHLIRPAAFVFATADGLAWVEPSYADPMGAASPAFHRRAGQAVRWNVVRAPDGDVEVVPYDPEDHRDLIGGSLDWFAGWLEAEGRSWADERERVRALLAGELL